MLTLAPVASLVGSPVRLAVFAGSRVATMTGLAVVWTRLRNDPHRWRRFILWMMVVNIVSWTAIVIVLRHITS